MPSPRISIIIPVLNEATCLLATLSALQVFRKQGHEILLVDGCSTDRSALLAKPYADQVLQTRPGRGHQMNAGAQAAQGDILWFLHADTRVPAGAVKQILRCLAVSSNVWGRFDVCLEPTSWLLRRIASLINLRSRWSGIATGDQGIFVRREMFERLGGYADIPIMEDVAMSQALKRQARPCCLRTPVVTSSRRWLGKGIFRTIMLMWLLRLAFFLGVSPARLAAYYR